LLGFFVSAALGSGVFLHHGVSKEVGRPRLKYLPQ
jgi:hypothetical protein